MTAQTVQAAIDGFEPHPAATHIAKLKTGLDFDIAVLSSAIYLSKIDLYLVCNNSRVFELAKSDWIFTEI